MTYRQFLKNGLNMDNIHLITVGPDIIEQIKTQPKIAKQALISICLDNLAREVYEMKWIRDLKYQADLKRPSTQRPR